MSEIPALFGVLQQSAQPEIAEALERLVREAPDHQLCRVNALAFAARQGLDEEQTIAAFLHRSEEHTSELQSLMRISYAVFCLKKNTIMLKRKEKYTTATRSQQQRDTIKQLHYKTY